jgi:hypothetical protein
MPLNTLQIEKLKKIPNRIQIYGDFTNELKKIKNEYIKDKDYSFSNLLPEELKKFIVDYKNELLKMPLSSLRNELGTNRQIFYLDSETSLVNITPNRIVAGFVTSGTGVLTDKYATDTEIIFIEDETGSIGVIFENKLIRGINYSEYMFSIGTSNSYPTKNDAHQTGGNLPSNDYRHNIRIGDMIIIQIGEYEPGVGYVYDSTRWVPNQGPSVIHGVREYVVDSEFRGISPTPYNLSGKVKSGLNNITSIDYNFRTIESDNRLVTLMGEFQFVDHTFPEYTPLYGEDLIFLPNRIYSIKTDEINAQKNTYRNSGIIKIVISQTSELARFGVKIPTKKFNYISGISMQDSETGERYIFPRFFSDIYPIDLQR